MMIPVPSSGVLEAVEGVDRAAAVPGVDEVQITARLHDFIAAWPEGSSYLGFIFARAETPATTETALRQAHQASCTSQLRRVCRWRILRPDRFTDRFFCPSAVAEWKRGS